MPKLKKQTYLKIWHLVHRSSSVLNNFAERHILLVTTLFCAFVLLLPNNSIPQTSGFGQWNPTTFGPGMNFETWDQEEGYRLETQEILRNMSQYEFSHDQYYLIVARLLAGRLADAGVCLPKSSPCTKNSECCGGNCQNFGAVNICN
jgi:hypothetical protein